MALFGFVFVFVLISAINAATSGSSKPEGRIIGGQPAQPFQFPFAAALNINFNGYGAFCVGSLINDQWILTAGQCVNRAVSANITLGTVSLSGTSPGRKQLTAYSFYVHPSYNPTFLLNDVGLIKLPTVIAFDDYIKPIRIPNINLLDYLQTTALGWGQKDAQIELSNELLYTPVTVITNEECRRLYGNQIVDHMVCTSGGQSTHGPCYYDTGSALVTYLEDAPYHNGIQSFVSGNGCSSGDPAGYIRTLDFAVWINATVAENL